MKTIKKFLTLSIIASLLFFSTGCSDESEDDTMDINTALAMILNNEEIKYNLIELENGNGFLICPSNPNDSCNDCRIYRQDDPENPYTYNGKSVNVIEDFMANTNPNIPNLTMKLGNTKTGYLSFDEEYYLHSNKSEGRTKITYQEVKLTRTTWINFRERETLTSTLGICKVNDRGDRYLLPLDCDSENYTDIGFKSCKITDTEKITESLSYNVRLYNNKTEQECGGACTTWYQNELYFIQSCYKKSE